MVSLVSPNSEYDLNVDQYKLKDLPNEIQSFIIERSASSKAKIDTFGVRVLTESYRIFLRDDSWNLLKQTNKDLLRAENPTTLAIMDVVDTGMYFGWAVSNVRDMAVLTGKIAPFKDNA